MQMQRKLGRKKLELMLEQIGKIVYNICSLHIK